MNRWINITFVLTACVGAVFSIGEIFHYQKLSKQHRMLAAETGFLEIRDPTKTHVVALPPEDSLHFRWRIYLPQHQTNRWKTSSKESNRTSTGPQDFIAQVRFRKSESGYVYLFEDMGSFENLLPLGGKSLAAFMLDRWDELETLQLGADGPTAIDPGDVVTLLELRMPPEMADEATSIISGSHNKRCIPVLYKMEVGTEEAWELLTHQPLAAEVSE